MKYKFTTSSARENTNAEKYIQTLEKFGTSDLIPMWIADMDLDSPSFIQEDLQRRLEHPIFGYETFPKTAFKAQISWLQKYYNTTYTVHDVFYTHSVTAIMNIVIETFSNIGDNIILQTPVYGPFETCIKEINREILLNELKSDADGFYRFDIEDLKSKVNKKTKVLFLCNPANPVGRAWSKNELADILQICIANNIIIFSDEVHCDLVYKPHKHTAFSTLKGAKDITISAYGIGKSFNLSGLGCSSVFIQNNTLKNSFKKVYDKRYFKNGNMLSHVAFQSAYLNGDQWISDLKEHLYENYLKLHEVILKYPKLLKLAKQEATYLAWIDCRGMNISDEKINSFFIKKVKIGINKGPSFGQAGKGHVRLNFAVSKEKIDKALNQLDSALHEYESQ